MAGEGKGTRRPSWLDEVGKSAGDVSYHFPVLSAAIEAAMHEEAGPIPRIRL